MYMINNFISLFTLILCSCCFFVHNSYAEQDFITKNIIFPNLAKKSAIENFPYREFVNTNVISSEEYSPKKDNTFTPNFFLNRNFSKEEYNRASKESSTVISQKDNSHKVYSFYTGINFGKVYFDNSDIFIEGIGTIGDMVLSFMSENNPLIQQLITPRLKEMIAKIKTLRDEINFQWLGSTYLGYHPRKNGRIDFEIMYSQIDIQNTNKPSLFDKKASTFTLLLNFYYEPCIKNTKFIPYFGLGVGPTLFRLKMVNGSAEELMPLNLPWFAYQAKFGIERQIIEEVNISLGYRYFSIPIPIADDISTHSLEIGLRFSF